MFLFHLKFKRFLDSLIVQHLKARRYLTINHVIHEYIHFDVYPKILIEIKIELGILINYQIKKEFCVEFQLRCLDFVPMSKFDLFM